MKIISSIFTHIPNSATAPETKLERACQDTYKWAINYKTLETKTYHISNKSKRRDVRVINQNSNQCSDAPTTQCLLREAGGAAAAGGRRRRRRRLAVFPARPRARGVFHEGRAAAAGPLAASREIARHSSQFG